MSKYIKSVLEIEPDNRLFSSGLTQLEKMTGNHGVDTRLIADVMSKAHDVMRKFGLDTKDTTAHELYFALNTAVYRGVAEKLLTACDYVLLIIDDQVISFNLIDVIENAHHELTFEKRITNHGKRSLMGELLNQYVNHSRTDDESVKEIAHHIGLTSSINS